MTGDSIAIQRELAAASLEVVRVLLKRFGVVGHGVKSINEVLRSYRDGIENALYSAFNGSSSQADLISTLSDLIQSLASEVYKEGMREGGSENPDEDISESDQSKIDDWIDIQISSLAAFTQSAIDVRSADDKESARLSLLSRVDSWVASLSSLGDMGNLSAQGDIGLTFTGEDGKENCETCSNLKGKRHKRSWWEKNGYLGRPNDNFICGRFEGCHHYFQDDDGNNVAD